MGMASDPLDDRARQVVWRGFLGVPLVYNTQLIGKEMGIVSLLSNNTTETEKNNFKNISKTHKSN